MKEDAGKKAIREEKLRSAYSVFGGLAFFRILGDRFY